MIIERMGKFHSIKEGGYFLAIPLVDDIRFVIDMRERALSIDPQSCITKDNVSVQVSGNLYCQFIDSQKAAYGAKNPFYAVRFEIRDKLLTYSSSSFFYFVESI